MMNGEAPHAQVKIGLGSLLMVVVVSAAVLWISGRDSVEGPIPHVSAAGGGGGAPSVVAGPEAVRYVVPATTLVMVAPEFQDRLEDLSKAADASPWEAHTVLELARLLDDADRPARAAVEYDRYVRLNPDSRAGWLYLANAHATAGDWAQAAQTSHRMLARFPESPPAMYNLGAALANQGSYEDARGWWERVLEGGDTVMIRRALKALERLSGY